MAKTSRRCRFALTLLGLAIAAATTVAHAQTFSVLYNFGTKSGDPTNPSSSGIVAQGRDGKMYSTALGGAAGPGAMFKITTGGKLTVPYSFNITDVDPFNPFSGLTLATDGNFYGATLSGGTFGMGTVFKITPSGVLTVLHSFAGSDGSEAYAPPIQGADGNFYGTARQGGANASGVVYKITPSGKFTTLYSFDDVHGYGPLAPLVQGTDGNFYGTAQRGGANEFYGVVYKITASGKFTVIYDFDGTHGGQPVGPLIQASDGSLYGTATGGGSKNSGVVFKVTAAGKYTVLHNINGTTDGSGPVAGLVQATDGKLYGTTPSGGATNQGTIFRISPTKPYSYKVLYNFDGTTGANPQVTLLQHTNGVLYGDTYSGGTGNVNPCMTGNCGVFYSLNVGLGPFVSLVSTSAKVGKSIGILGQGFTGTTGVSFNGTAAIFNISSDTYLTATVPNGATTGPVTVVTPSGTLTSNKAFRVTPVILSFDPTSGPVGTPVTITGTSFTGATKVTFGGVKATSFTVDSDSQVTATVPTGAKTGKIAITTPGGTATSPGVFTVTP
jgi:uncharacterized repeat protein (TIGR03803 family)